MIPLFSFVKFASQVLLSPLNRTLPLSDFISNSGLFSGLLSQVKSYSQTGPCLLFRSSLALLGLIFSSLFCLFDFPQSDNLTTFFSLFRLQLNVYFQNVNEMSSRNTCRRLLEVLRQKARTEKN